MAHNTSIYTLFRYLILAKFAHVIAPLALGKPTWERWLSGEETREKLRKKEKLVKEGQQLEKWSLFERFDTLSNDALQQFPILAIGVILGTIARIDIVLLNILAGIPLFLYILQSLVALFAGPSIYVWTRRVTRSLTLLAGLLMIYLAAGKLEKTILLLI
ncbi:hypothetical protein K491DRAFT_775125 [Lophiostoma macrostomum CBS 122681]|uniref:Uncharacterized protein n=1 Tax=Lophiostoma macrostomum CBS 122681 TaxID=1314788 RepID=A0A6A6TLR9_9PLEO|nr:hypothetical protein K491DRAFT_775125 [Lophiostoma macrostomum CBS 122681]